MLLTLITAGGVLWSAVSLETRIVICKFLKITKEKTTDSTHQNTNLGNWFNVGNSEPDCDPITDFLATTRREESMVLSQMLSPSTTKKLFSVREKPKEVAKKRKRKAEEKTEKPEKKRKRTPKTSDSTISPDTESLMETIRMLNKTVAELKGQHGALVIPVPSVSPEAETKNAVTDLETTEKIGVAFDLDSALKDLEKLSADIPPATPCMFDDLDLCDNGDQIFNM